MRRAMTAMLMGIVMVACDDGSTTGTSDVAVDTLDTVDTRDSASPELDVVDAQDSFAPDETQAETTPVDTALPDTVVDTMADTTAPDTVADTVPDTSVSDTNVSDTSVGDTTTAPPDPAKTGPFTVKRETVTVAGFAAVLFVPESATPVPAIVLAPGFQLDGNAFELYGSHLASHGIATLIPTFGDSLFAPLTHSALADSVVAMVAWLAADTRFDATRLGAAGHSRGGKLAILATTRSSTIRATFGLDPVDTPGGPGAVPSADNPSVTPELMAAVTVPFAVLGSAYGGTAASAFAPACAPVEDNYHQYALAAANAPVVYEWVAPGSGHNDFADPLPFLVTLACQAGDDPPATRTLAKTRLTAFFLRHLAGDLRYTLP